MRVLPKLPDESVDLILCDPPYGINFQSSWRPNTKRLRKIANDKAPFIWWIPEARRVLKPTGCLITFFRWDVQEPFLMALEIGGLPANGVCIWDKEVHGMGDLKRQFAPRHELFAFSPAQQFTFAGKRPASVIHIPRVSNDKLFHPNQKPVELFEELIRTTTKPGATILDPFMGSGSAGVAASRVGERHFIGIEMDQKYFELAKAYIERR